MPSDIEIFDEVKPSMLVLDFADFRALTRVKAREKLKLALPLGG